MIRIAVAEDHPEVRVALRLLLRTSPAVEVICETSNGQEAVACVESLLPDVLVMDIRMPVLDGYAATRYITSLHLPTRIILISTYSGKFFAQQAADVGAHGFVPKDRVIKSLLPAIEAVHRGEFFFLEK